MNPASAAVGIMTDYYAILGVPQHAKEEQIKAAFRKKAKIWHPDVCSKPEAHERFMAISKAYETLIDPARRARYDKAVLPARASAMKAARVSVRPSPSLLTEKFAAGVIGMLFIVVLSLAILGFAVPVAVPVLILLSRLLLRMTKTIGLSVVVTYTVLASTLLLSLLLLGLGIAYLSL
ncbi:MAG: J domain-containing protein [Firmicutes bacterium]|jgi:preprotein translocase subunit Sec63|nr:J domain-containing protein [Bacillota bacterium]MDD4336590.1 J domain-containing protein [Bacillota bacterium]MDD4792642.1 J domain-containing protein [Bacillota bacterium]